MRLQYDDRVTVIPMCDDALQAVTTPYVAFEHPFVDRPSRLTRQADVFDQNGENCDWVLGDVWPNNATYPHMRWVVRRALHSLPQGQHLEAHMWPETVMYRTSAARQFKIDPRIKYRPQMAFWLQMYERLGHHFIALGSISTEAYIEVIDREFYPVQIVGAPTALGEPELPLTVLVITQDHATTVVESLISLLAQSFSDFEVRIVDCSRTEDTWVALQEEIEDDRIVSRQRAQYAGEAAVLALNGSRGRRIAIWDPATVSVRDRLAAQIEMQADLVGCEWARMDGDNVHALRSDSLLHSSTTRSLAPVIPPSTMIFDRRLVAERGFDPALSAEWAYAFQARMVINREVHVAKIHANLVTRLDGAISEEESYGQYYCTLVRRDIMDQCWKGSNHVW